MIERWFSCPDCGAPGSAINYDVTVVHKHARSVQVTVSCNECGAGGGERLSGGRDHPSGGLGE